MCWSSFTKKEETQNNILHAVLFKQQPLSCLKEESAKRWINLLTAHMARCSKDGGGVTVNLSSNGSLNKRSLFLLMNQAGWHFYLLKLGSHLSEINCNAARSLYKVNHSIHEEIATIYLAGIKVSGCHGPCGVRQDGAGALAGSVRGERGRGS